MNNLRFKMSVTPSAWSVLMAVCVILGVHIFSMFQELYNTLWWLDIVLHIAGGAWVALAFFYFQRTYAPLFSTVPFWFSLIAVVGVVMLVGVAWEWFEFGFDYIFLPEHAELRLQLGLADTMGDLLSDFVGGVLLALYFLLKKNSN